MGPEYGIIDYNYGIRVSGSGTMAAGPADLGKGAHIRGPVVFSGAACCGYRIGLGQEYRKNSIYY